MEITDFTPEQIERFIEIKKALDHYNSAMLTKSVPLPYIPIDERMMCEQFFKLKENGYENETSALRHN